MPFACRPATEADRLNILAWLDALRSLNPHRRGVIAGTASPLNNPATYASWLKESWVAVCEYTPAGAKAGALPTPAAFVAGWPRPEVKGTDMWCMEQASDPALPLTVQKAAKVFANHVYLQQTYLDAGFTTGHGESSVAQKKDTMSRVDPAAKTARSPLRAAFAAATASASINLSALAAALPAGYTIEPSGWVNGQVVTLRVKSALSQKQIDEAAAKVKATGL